MIRAYAVLIVITLFLSACGGSSGTPGATQPPIIGADPLVISSTNAKPAVRIAYGAALQSIETGSLVGGAGGVVSTPGALQKPVAQSALSGLLNRALQKVPFGPDEFPCAIAGSTTISGDVQSPFGLTVGDQINVESTDCDEGLGEVINGSIEMTVTAFSGDILTNMYLLAMSVVLIDFEVVSAGNTLMSNGDSTVSIDLTGNPMVVVSINGNAMTTQINTRTDSVIDFMTSQSVDTSVMPEPYTMSSSGTIDSTELSGRIDYSTPVTFQGSGADYPFAGEFLVTGADGASIRLIALDNTNVRIETDTNGDGTPDSTEDTTWSDIATLP